MGQEKGQAPGRQINLMKFVIDCGNTSLVINTGISHKKLLIKTLSLAPSSHFLLYGGSNHSNCSLPFKDSNEVFLWFQRATGGHVWLPAGSKVPTFQALPSKTGSCPVLSVCSLVPIYTAFCPGMFLLIFQVWLKTPLSWEAFSDCDGLLPFLGSCFLHAGCYCSHRGTGFASAVLTFLDLECVYLGKGNIQSIY